uniref:LAGLIDADG homing endonuclease n=1 Tax=Myochromella boudieri TaxID=117066 RepID=A0A386TY32_9AGAR|nr:LAGLIDADG homing endonuclease [Myochromella boudieri]AYE93137.1 LAGLIDADG homing endonuclease [Myochromella boudieri]
MQQTICENFNYNLLDTLSISCIFSTTKVKNLLNLNNSQVTKASNSRIGTSEAIRLLNIDTKSTLKNSSKKILPFSLYSATSDTLRVASERYHLTPQLEESSVRGCEFPSLSRSPIPYANYPSFKDKGERGAGMDQGSVSHYPWKEWVAGLIDGDGSFLLTKKGYASLEITMDIRDEHALLIIKNEYGGSIKLRSGANALRYRLHHKKGLLNLIKDVNGHIRNSNRLVQLNKICHKYELNLIYPNKLNFDSGWLSGFFDADGTVTINKTNTQLSISASQKTSELLQPLIELYGGIVYIDRGCSQSFKWYISKREDILKIIEYFKKHPSSTAKKNRLHLIPQYYKLKDLKAHKALPGTFLYKSWQYFYSNWLKYEDPNNGYKL